MTSVAGSKVKGSQKISACSSSQMETITDNQSKLEVASGLEGLQNSLLVAKKASYMVNENGLSAISEINFVTKKQKIICGDSKNKTQSAYFLTAPALIDLRSPQRMSPSYWQFQLVLTDGDIGTWGTSTKMKDSDFRKILVDQRLRVKVYQVDHDEIEVHYSRPQRETLVISYDLLQSRDRSKQL